MKWEDVVKSKEQGGVGSRKIEGDEFGINGKMALEICNRGRKLMEIYHY